jgi:DNA-binding MarR family transcriptional regulator
MARGTRKQQLIAELGELFRVSGIQDNAFDDATAERLGINRTDLNCIDIIERHGGVTAGELAAESGLSSGAVTAVIDRLERAGYARRVRDPDDRRRVRVEVTTEVRRAADELYGPMLAEWNAMMNAATVEQLQLMVGFMREANEVKPRHIERVRKPDSGVE